MSKNILLLSDQVLKDRSIIHGNMDPKLLYNDIKLAQDKYIHPLLGTALFIRLQTEVDTKIIAGDYKDLLDDYIIDTLINYTLSELPTSISYQFWNKGIVRKNGENTELPSMSELLDISAKYKNNAEFYARRLERYLKQYAPTKFPEYLNPGTGIDTVRPINRPFSMPVFLGDEYPCQNTDPHRFEKKYQGNRPFCDDDCW
jgi:hypothetical protein